MNCNRRHPNLNECLNCKLRQTLDERNKCVNIRGCQRFKTTSSRCEVCEAQYFLDQGSGTCTLRTLSGCAQGDPFKDQCLECESGYYCDGLGGHVCLSYHLVQNCEQYHDDLDLCSACSSGYVLTHNRCEPASSSVGP